MTDKGWVSEIFVSVQGEGIFLGKRQVFVRMSGCRMKCRYCDTPRQRTEKCMIRTSEAGRPVVILPNPVSAGLIQNLITCHEPREFHSVSITGGEPLEQTGFLSEILPGLQQESWKIYLETAGTLYSALEKVIRHVDIVSMDIKLRSATGKQTQWDSHRRFLKAARGKNVFVKVVVVPETSCRELEKAVHLVSAVDRKIPFVIQPATRRKPSLEKILEWQKSAEKSLADVRIIPQVHPFLTGKRG